MDRTNKTYNGVPITSLLTPTHEQPDLVQRIATRKTPAPLTISDPEPLWPTHYETFKSRILSAFENQPSLPTSTSSQEEHSPFKRVEIISISHIGSTSIPLLPAKPIIDIDLVLSPSSSLSYEPHYIPLLESAGFTFLLREPHWHEHRFLVASPPSPINCNLHVWGSDDRAEVERHVIFRDWLRSVEGEGDRELYEEVKREAVRVSVDRGEDVRGYTARKEGVVREILGRAFEWVGVLEEEVEEELGD